MADTFLRYIFCLLSAVVSQYTFGTTCEALMAATPGPELRSQNSIASLRSAIPEELTSMRMVLAAFEKAGIQFSPPEKYSHARTISERAQILPSGAHPLNRLARALGRNGQKLYYSPTRVGPMEALHDPEENSVYLNRPRPHPLDSSEYRFLDYLVLHEWIHTRTTRAKLLPRGFSSAMEVFWLHRSFSQNPGDPFRSEFLRLDYFNFLRVDEIFAYLNTIRTSLGRLYSDIRLGMWECCKENVQLEVSYTATDIYLVRFLSEGLQSAITASRSALNRSSNLSIYENLYKDKGSYSCSLELPSGSALVFYLGPSRQPITGKLARKWLSQQLEYLNLLVSIALEVDGLKSEIRALALLVSGPLTTQSVLIERIRSLHRKTQSIHNRALSIYNRELHRDP